MQKSKVTVTILTGEWQTEMVGPHLMIPKTIVAAMDFLLTVMVFSLTTCFLRMTDLLVPHRPALKLDVEEQRSQSLYDLLMVQRHRDRRRRRIVRIEEGVLEKVTE